MSLDINTTGFTSRPAEHTWKGINWLKTARIHANGTIIHLSKALDEITRVGFQSAHISLSADPEAVSELRSSLRDIENTVAMIGEEVDKINMTLQGHANTITYMPDGIRFIT